MNIQEQWEQDVKDFGDNACLMYKVRAEHNSACLVNAMNNPHVISRFSNILRKQSAELPFDLERAKAGEAIVFSIEHSEVFPIDVVFITESSNLNNVFIQDSYGIQEVEIKYLRMKYPKRYYHE